MRLHSVTLVAVCLLLCGPGRAHAGGIHIRYKPDAPEKMADSNIRYYEGVVSLEHNHPSEFAQEHPFYTKMFDDPVMLDNLLARWEAHEERFEYWHDCLWKVLDGYRALHEGLPPGLSSSVPQNPLDVGSVGVTDRNGGSPGSVGPQGLQNEGGGGGVSPSGGGGGGVSPSGGGGGGVGTSAVPEPSTGLLLLLGLSFAGPWLLSRRRRRVGALALRPIQGRG